MNFTKYKNQMEYPARPHKPRLQSDPLPRVVREYADKLELHQAKTAQYQEAMSLYRAEDRRLHELFKADLLEDVGLAKYPKRDAVFDYAWEKGHSSGHQRVLSVMQDLVELIVI